jgi:hypothetical protein
MFSESALIGMKAVKNEVEADGMLTSHVRDAVALAEFFSHLEQDVSNEKKNYTELSAADLVRHSASIFTVTCIYIEFRDIKARLKHKNPKNKL